jgi:hypothetical protein
MILKRIRPRRGLDVIAFEILDRPLGVALETTSTPHPSRLCGGVTYPLGARSPTNRSSAGDFERNSEDRRRNARSVAVLAYV